MVRLFRLRASGPLRLDESYALERLSRLHGERIEEGPFIGAESLGSLEAEGDSTHHRIAYPQRHCRPRFRRSRSIAVA